MTLDPSHPLKDPSTAIALAKADRQHTAKQKQTSSIGGRKLAMLQDLTAQLRRSLKKHDFNPLDKLIELYNSTEAKVGDKITIALELLSYTAPKLKSIDLTQKGGTTIKVVLNDFKQEIRDNTEEASRLAIEVKTEAILDPDDEADGVGIGDKPAGDPVL